VHLTATTLVGVEASDGKLLWRYDRPSNTLRINCTTPWYHEGIVYASSAYDAGCGAVKLSKKNSSGGIAANEVFFTPRMKNHHGGLIIVDDCLYGGAVGIEGGFLVCLELETGKVLWSERRAPIGSSMLADERIYVRGERGELILIEPNRERYVERGGFEQPDRTREPAWAHPVIANGRLYVRDQDALFCYDITRK
jgi:outer membrane protein assembly factor BamB